MRTRETCCLVVALGAILVGGPVAAQETWTVDAATEPSRVTLGARDVTWWTNRLQLANRAGPGQGWYVAAETQHREQGNDKALSGGAFGRIGSWIWYGQASVSGSPNFLPRYSLEPQLGRQFGNTVLQAGAVYKSFQQSNVRIGTLEWIVYRGDSELEFKGAYGSVNPSGHRVRVATVRGLWNDGGAFSYGFGVSVGLGLYDSSNVPGISGNHGWIVNASARYRIDDRNSVRLDLTQGREHPGFRQETLGLSFRSAF